jgi:hypothetical protein
MKPLHTLIQEQIEDYTSKKVTITDKYEFSQYETLQQIENFTHSRFGSGQNDSRGNPKPFFNITKGKVNIAVRATDLDRKDIRIKTADSDNYFRAFVASKFNHQLMKKMKMADYLNAWGERLPKYGSVVTKIVERKGNLDISVMDWMNFVCDPVDFDSAPQIEKLTLTVGQLRDKVKEGWDEDAIEQLIDAKKEPRKTLRGKTVYEDPSYITVYELHGLLPIAYLKDKPKETDWKKYTRQMQVIAWQVNDKKEREDFTLYKGKEKKTPYSISHWTKADGRTLGVGVVEDMFQPQIWHNYNIKKMKDQLDLASTTILATSDGNLAARNVLSNLQNGDFVIHAVNQPITAINLAPQGVEGLQALSEMWQKAAEDITSTPDAISGSTMPSGTAFRQVAMLNTEAHSYFDYITECKGNYIEYLYREYIIPYIMKQLETTEEIVAVLDTQEIEWLDNAVADIAVTDEIKKQTLAGAVVSPIQLDQLRQQKLQDLKRTGAKRFINPGSGTWKTYFKDFEWEADIDITGESEDKKTIIDTLYNALATVAQNPGILTNPTMKMLFMRLLDASGVVSPLDIETAAASQPSAQTQQPGQPGQPGQGQPPQSSNLLAGPMPANGPQAPVTQ